MNRRSFLSAILAAGVAPAVVRASSLMKVSGWTQSDSGLILGRTSSYGRSIHPQCTINSSGADYAEYEGFIEELSSLTRRVWTPRLVDQIYHLSPTLSSIMAE